MNDDFAKNPSKSLVVPTALTTDEMVLKFFPEAIFLLKVDHFKGFLNWFKID